MKKYVGLEKYNITFKNLLSGPAPIGRILNYIIFAGENSIYHQPGSRNLYMENNIGSAWCVEFMIGLGLIKLGDKLPNSNIYSIKLTTNGKLMYNILYENALEPSFDESSNPKIVLDELKDKGALNIIHVFEKVFRSSPIFLNLLIFLNIKNTDKNFIEIEKTNFREDLFGELKEFYEGEKYNRGKAGQSSASTASNRVPSLIQLCMFLNYLDQKGSNYIFNVVAFKDGIFDESYKLDISDEYFIKELEKQEKIIEKLSENFGILGTRNVVNEVRLSQVQLIFKQRLIKEHGAHCWLCGIEHEELLIASHIKNAAECDIHGKANNNNGLLLCAMHDKLFDRYLISFNLIDGAIIISSEISEKDRRLANIDENMILNNELMNEERSEFLIWHNEEFYKKENK